MTWGLKFWTITVKSNRTGPDDPSLDNIAGPQKGESDGC